MRYDPDLHRSARAVRARSYARPARRGGVGWRAVAMAVVLGLGIGALAGPDGAAWLERAGAVASEVVPPAPGRAADAGATVRGVRFGLCHSGGGANCVVDGDTFWLRGERIRIADIDTPETHPPRCAEEARLGKAATLRLRALLNAGPVTLEVGEREVDRYGRKLRVVTRGGESLGEVLVAEGLARPWAGRRRGWC